MPPELINTRPQRRSDRMRVLLATGLYALACWPASLVADRFHWRQDFIFTTAVLACVVCAVTGVVHLLADRGRPEEPVLFVPTRKVALAAVVVTGGFVLLLGLLIVGLLVSPPFR